MSDELVYRRRALAHRAQVPGTEEEPLDLPVAWSRWTWPVVILTVAAAGALVLALPEGG